MSTKLKFAAVMVSAALLSACGGSSHNDQIDVQPPPPPAAAIDEAYQGNWISEAYGQVLVISESSVEYYRYTSDYCLLQDDFTDVTTADLIRSVDFIDSTEKLTWYVGTGTREFHAPARELEKVAEVPASCVDNKLTADSALTNPEMFALYSQIMDEYYVDFSRQNVDWSALMYQLEGDITSQTDTLYEAIYQSLLPLADSHNSWQANDGTLITVNTKPTHATNLIEEYALANGLSFPLEESELNNTIVANIESYIETAIEQEINAVLSYATSNVNQDDSEELAWFAINNIGYLRIDAMTGFSSADEEADDLAQVTSALNNVNEVLDEVLTDFAFTDGMIIDIRYNGGGNDYISLAIASRFTESEFLAYKKYAREGAGVTATRESYVEPSEFVNYTGKPVVVLVSNETASAAETFSLTMHQLDHVTFVGEPTHGIFSDIMTWVLPGEHQLGLSNEVYLSPDDVWYEGVGVPVDIEVPFFPLEDRIAGKDSGLEAALNALQ
ncbi:S41 family peptidase [Alteromonas lipolytica]|uniref:Tail specific protease domain-containing protein n=1 Tax=Alteromonas lipolytica TaxID=1856405 RepID=A0A1E8FFU8_9ALTE|nr:S41 family peptidase [Alteromonas lipolytica]OFI34822.1 hypothetical protein BFC17_14705 [Alteromonas lipolytica]GGF54270.1 hypothetical protein GCM10011338_03080 [Alteromonas lipolytica]